MPLSKVSQLDSYFYVFCHMMRQLIEKLLTKTDTVLKYYRKVLN